MMIDKKLCPRCGKMIEYRSKFCWDCTWERKKTHCIDCGKQIRKRQKRCWECHKKAIVVSDQFCIDCKQKLPRYSDGTRCRQCYLDCLKNIAKVWKCIDCGKVVNRRAKRCSECDSKFRKEKPSYERTAEYKKKMSEIQKCIPRTWLVGKKYGPETIKKRIASWTEERREAASTKWQGQGNPGYIHGNGKRPWPREFNSKLRTSIRKRDSYECQLCSCMMKPSSRMFDIHHIDYDKENNKCDNLIGLCRSCHAKTNFNRSQWQSYFEQLQVLRTHNQFLPVSNLLATDTILPQNPETHKTN